MPILVFSSLDKLIWPRADSPHYSSKCLIFHPNIPKPGFNFLNINRMPLHREPLPNHPLTGGTNPPCPELLAALPPLLLLVQLELLENSLWVTQPETMLPSVGRQAARARVMPEEATSADIPLYSPKLEEPPMPDGGNFLPPALRLPTVQAPLHREQALPQMPTLLQLLGRRQVQRLQPAKLRRRTTNHRHSLPLEREWVAMDEARVWLSV
jgi:hypothetical protein